jgi:hypothetical protein
MSAPGAGEFHPVVVVDLTTTERAHRRNCTKNGALYKGRLSAVEVRRVALKATVAGLVADQ